MTHSLPNSPVGHAAKSSLLSRIKRSTCLKFRRFKQDEDGVAALEFALIAPVMIMIYCGLVEVLLLVEADRNVTQAASVVGDLVAQNEILSIDDQTNYVNAALSILNTTAEVSGQDVGIEVISYEAESGASGREVSTVGYAVFGQLYDSDSSASKKLNGSGHNTVDESTFDATTISEDLFPEGSGIVVARVNYTYTSPLRYFVQTPTLRETFFFKPRRSATVVFDNGAGHSDTATMFCEIKTDATTSVSKAECEDVYSPEESG